MSSSFGSEAKRHTSLLQKISLSSKLMLIFAFSCFMHAEQNKASGAKRAEARVYNFRGAAAEALRKTAVSAFWLRATLVLVSVDGTRCLIQLIIMMAQQLVTLTLSRLTLAA